jgi:hypothetical protein
VEVTCRSVPGIPPVIADDEQIGVVRMKRQLEEFILRGEQDPATNNGRRR